MATYIDITGFESGGIHEVFGSTGAPTATNTYARSGTYSCQLDAGDEIRPTQYVQGFDLIVGFAFRVSSKTPSVATTLFRQYSTAGAGDDFSLRLDTDGDLELIDANGSIAETETDPLTAGQWHYIEIYWTSHANTATYAINLDGSLIMNGVADLFHTSGSHSPYIGNTSGSGVVIYVDDIYITVSNSGAGDMFDEPLMTFYQNTAEDATDQGATLSSGTWADVGEAPLSQANTGAYTASTAQSGYTICDEGSRAGPSGDLAAGSTIHIVKWCGQFYRGNGGTTTHYLVYGHNGDADQTEEISLSGSWSWHEIGALGNAVHAPTLSEYAAIGFQKTSGGRQIYCSDLYTYVLYSPPAGTDTSDSQAAYLEGSQDTSSQQDAYIAGSLVVSSQQDAYIEGIAGVESRKSAYVVGSDSTNASQNAYIAGGVLDSDSQSAFIHGGVISGDSQSVYIAGFDTATDNQETYILGSLDSGDIQSAYIAGSLGDSDSQSAFIHGGVVTSDSQSSYIEGFVPGIPISDNVSAYIQGSLDASDSRSAYLSGSASAWVKIIGNEGALRVTGDSQSYAKSILNAVDASNVEALVKFRFSHNLAQAKFRLFIMASRDWNDWETPTSAFEVEIASDGAYQINRIASGSRVPVSGGDGTWAGDQNNYWVRFQAIGTALKLKIWEDGTGEPGAWTKEVASTALSAGTLQIGLFRQSGNNVHDLYFDDLSYHYPGTLVFDNQAAYIEGSSAEIPVSDSQSAYIAGGLQANGSQLAYIQGQDTDTDSKSAYLFGSVNEVDSQSAFVQGQDTTSDSRSAYIVGGVKDTDSQPAFIYGQDTTTSSQPAYMLSGNIASGSQDAYIAGTDTIDDSQSAYIAGGLQTSDSQAAYVLGSIDDIDSQSAYIFGSVDEVDDQSAFIQGQDTASDSKSAYIAGGIEDVDSKEAFVHGQDAATSSQSAFIPSGDVTTDSQGAYITGVDTASDSQSAYIAGGVQDTDSQAAYVDGFDTALDSQAAYIVGGVQEIGSQSAFIQGQDTTSDSQSAYVAGGVQDVDSQSVFIQGQDTISDSQSAYIAGGIQDVDSQPAFVQGQGTDVDSQEAYVLGSLDAADSQAAYVVGAAASVDSKSAYIAGTGTEVDSQSAYIEGLTFFPFTDDFTGSNDDEWDRGLWVTSIL